MPSEYDLWLERSKDPKTWTWQKRKWTLTGRKMSFPFEDETLEVLEELERTQQAQKLKETLELLAKQRDLFSEHGSLGASQAVQAALKRYFKESFVRSHRRTFLVVAGIASVGFAMKILNVENIEKLLERSEPRSELRFTFVDKKYGKEVLEDVKAVLAKFDAPSECTPRELSMQVALHEGLVKSEKDAYGGETVVSKDSQKLLLPTRYPNHPLIISDYHSWKGLKGNALFIRTAAGDQELYNAGLFCFSEDADIALGICKMIDPIPLKMPSFCTSLSVGEMALNVPSAASKNREWRSQTGKILHISSRHIFSKMNLIKGDSGSPLVLTDGRIIGIQVRKDVNNEPIGTAVNAATIKKMLESFVKEFS